MENTLVGRCRLVRKIGQGGMGEVWLARHETLQKDVAVKILPADFARHSEAVERFLREARSAARLEHPNVVQVLDAGSQDGTHYIVMQYVDGTDLEKIQKKKGRLSTADALAVVRRVAVALGAAHKLGIVHRDIKPSNILVTRKQGRVMVADFGLAREIGGDAGLTTEGSVMGTPHYLSPEQARGEAVDGRSDLYSLGGTLYTLLSGAMPYTGATPLSVAVKHASPTDRPRPLRELVPELSPEVEGLVEKLMAKKAADRFQTAEEVVASIDRLKSAKAAASSIGIVVDPVERRRQLRTAGAIAAITLVLLFVFLAAVGQSPEEKAFRAASKAKTEEERLAGYREVARTHPKTPWADRAAEEIERAFQRELKAAAARPFAEAVKALDGLRARHPGREAVVDKAEDDLHRARVASRTEGLAEALRNERARDAIRDYVPPESMRKFGEQAVLGWMRLMFGLLLGREGRFETVKADPSKLELKRREKALLPVHIVVQRRFPREERQEHDGWLEWTWLEGDWYLGDRAIRNEK